MLVKQSSDSNDEVVRDESACASTIELVQFQQKLTKSLMILFRTLVGDTVSHSEIYNLRLRDHQMLEIKIPS